MRDHSERLIHTLQDSFVNPSTQQRTPKEPGLDEGRFDAVGESP